jgi:hypothetical protein
VHNFYVTASYVPKQQVRLYGTVVYNKSTGSLDPIDFPDVEDQLDGGLEHMDYHFDQVHTYSDIDFALWRFSAGFDYRFSPLWKGTLDFNYADLSDSAPYVYGNESGSYFVVRAAARMSF